MINYLKGQITEVYDEYVILESYGVGYEIFCKDAHKYLVDDKTETKFYIFEHIQETAHTLYGFDQIEDLDMLKLLISVKGVGPKVGLKILNAVSIGIIVSAIEQEDPDIFPPIKSVGDKGKKRLINELKGKIPDSLLRLSSQEMDGTQIKSVASEALEALVSLGMHQNEAQNTIQRAPKEIEDTGELVKWVLKNK